MWQSVCLAIPCQFCRPSRRHARRPRPPRHPTSRVSPPRFEPVVNSVDRECGAVQVQTDKATS